MKVPFVIEKNAKEASMKPYVTKNGATRKES